MLTAFQQGMKLTLAEDEEVEAVGQNGHIEKFTKNINKILLNNLLHSTDMKVVTNNNNNRNRSKSQGRR